MADKIQVKRGLKANLPTLSIGEPAYCIDTKEFFVGTANGNVLVNDHGEIIAQLAEKAKQTDVTAGLAAKVDKVTGKGLSTNDYDSAEKAEVAKVKDKADKSDLDTTNATVAGHTAQLAEKAKQTDLNTTNNTVALKADKSYVDTKFGNMGNTKTFKGSSLFASLPASGNAIDDYWYVSDRTSNYCWNGSTWVDIGNNLNIADNTITTSKLNFTKHINLFNKYEPSIVTLTKNASAMTFINDATLKSVVVKVEPNTTYTISKPTASSRFAVYTCPNYPITGGTITTVTNGSSNTLYTVTSGALDNYLVVYCYNATYDTTITFEQIIATLQVEKGSIATAYTDYSIVTWDALKLAENNFTEKNIISSVNIKDGAISASKVDFTQMINLFDKSTATTVALIKNSSNLTFVGAAGVKSVIFPCKPSTTYTISKTKSARFTVYSSVAYPVSGGVITNVVSDDTGVSKVTITTGASDSYLTTYFYHSSDTFTESQILDTLQIELGSTSSQYTSYGKFKISNLITNDTNNVNGLLYDNKQLAERLRKLQKQNDFAWKNYDKPYVTFCFDDYRADLSLVYNIFAEFGFPLCCAIPSSLVTSQTVSLLLTIQSNGGEILSHGNGSIPVTSTNYTDEAFMLSEIRDSKKVLESFGLTVNGWVAPGGGSTQPDLQVYENYQRRYYDYGSSGVATQYAEWRNGLTSGVAPTKTAIDSAIASKSWVRFYAHTLDGTEANVNESNLRTILQYCKDNNITVTTYKYLHDTFGTTVLEKRLTALESK